MVSVLEFTAAVSAGVGVALAVFTVVQLLHMEKHRNVEVSMKLFEWAETEKLHKAFRWVERSFQFESYEKFRVAEEANSEVSDYPYEVAAFFEEVGFLVKKNFVDLDVVDDRLGTHIISSWKKLEPWILALRKEQSDKTFGEHFQSLYEKTVRYMRNRQAPLANL